MVAFDGYGIAGASRSQKEVLAGLFRCFHGAYLPCLLLCHASFAVAGISLVQVGHADTGRFNQHSGSGLVPTAFRVDDDSSSAGGGVRQRRALSAQYHSHLHA